MRNATETAPPALVAPADARDLATCNRAARNVAEAARTAADLARLEADRLAGDADAEAAALELEAAARTAGARREDTAAAVIAAGRSYRRQALAGAAGATYAAGLAWAKIDAAARGLEALADALGRALGQAWAVDVLAGAALEAGDLARDDTDAERLAHLADVNRGRVGQAQAGARAVEAVLYQAAIDTAGDVDKAGAEFGRRFDPEGPTDAGALDVIHAEGPEADQARAELEVRARAALVAVLERLAPLVARLEGEPVTVAARFAESANS